MKRVSSAVLTLLILFSCVQNCSPVQFSSASAENGNTVQSLWITVSGGTAIYSISDESFVRYPADGETSLKNDEYITFIADVKSTSLRDHTYTNVYFRVDGGNKLALSDLTLKAGQTVRCHIWHSNMENLSPGMHLVQFFMSDQLVYSQRLYLMRDWTSKMTVPSSRQIASVKNLGRSPYIVFWPDFPGVSGFTEYAIDFSIDHMDDGTYFCTMGGHMDLSEFQKLHGSNWSGGDFYCGVQCWENGKTAVIMSVWDVVPKNGAASGSIVCANQLYPTFKAGVSKDSEEGRFQQFLIEYPWSAQHPYRMLMQKGTYEKNGNATLTMWLCDLITQEWTKLVTWDLGYPSPCIRTDNVYGFMENYLSYAAGYIRTANFSSIRCRDAKTGQWKAVKSVYYTVNNSSIAMDYNGSYSFGADDDTFWIITSGVSGLCTLPKEGSYSVQRATSQDPY